jgi:hypothetical protein
LARSFRKRGRLLAADQVDLAALADIDPETGHAGARWRSRTR